MKHLCTSLTISIAVASAFAISQQHRALAQMPGGATEVTQLANHLMLGEQLANQAQQIQNLLLNTKGFSSQIWGTAMQDISKLSSLLQQAKNLASSAGNLDGQFASEYGTYDSYLTKKMGTSDWKSKYEQWSKEASDNALYTLQGLSLQSSQMQDEDSLIKQLQSMAETADGRMQALQVANMMAAQTVDQIRKLRALIMMQVQMQANYLAAQQDQDAAWKAQRDNLLQTWKPTPYSDGKVF